jgi:hypothetical protein
MRTALTLGLPVAVATPVGGAVAPPAAPAGSGDSHDERPGGDDAGAPVVDDFIGRMMQRDIVEKP